MFNVHIVSDPLMIVRDALAFILLLLVQQRPNSTSSIRCQLIAGHRLHGLAFIGLSCYWTRHSYFPWRQTKLCLQTTTQRHLLTLPPPFVSVSLILFNCVLSVHNKRICYVMLCYVRLIRIMQSSIFSSYIFMKRTCSYVSFIHLILMGICNP